MLSFGPGTTVNLALNGNWLAPNYRMSIPDDTSTQRLIDLYNAVSSYAGNLSEAEQFMAFQVLYQLRNMYVPDMGPEAFVKRDSKITKIHATLTGTAAEYIRGNITQFVIVNRDDLQPWQRQEKLMLLMAEAIKKAPEILDPLAQILLSASSTLTKNDVRAGDNVGGIDFNPNLLDLQIKRNGRGVPLPLPMQDIDKINIEGLYPVILNISPARIENLPFLMGTKPKPQTDQLSLVK